MRYFIFLLIVSIFLNCKGITESKPDESDIVFKITDYTGENIKDAGLHFSIDFNLDAYYQNVNKEKILNQVPVNFYLYNNFPDPFDWITTILFQLPESSNVTLQIFMYNRLKPVRTLVDGNLRAGNHSISWDGTDDNGQYVTNNLYKYKLTAGNYVEVEEMFLNRIDPFDIQSRHCIPLLKSNTNGEIVLDQSILPIGKELTWTEETGIQIGNLTIPDSLTFVFIKEGYNPATYPLKITENLGKKISIQLEKSN